MSLIPVGTQKKLKQQQVRPHYATDFSALLKLGQHQMAPTAPGVDTQKIDLGGQGAPDAVGGEPAPEMGGDDGSTAIDQTSDNLDLDQIAHDADQQVAESPDPMSDPSQNPEDEQNLQVQEDQADEQQAHSEVLKLRYELGAILDKMGLAYKPTTSPKSLKVDVDVTPKILIQSTGERRPAHQVMRRVVEWAHSKGMGVTEPVESALDQQRSISKPKGKGAGGTHLTYTFTFTPAQAGDNESVEETTIAQPPEQTVPKAQMPQPKPKVQPKIQPQPAQAKPMAPKPQGKPQMPDGNKTSKMGNPGMQETTASAKTLREVFASRKDDLMNTLNKIVGHNGAH